MDNNTTVKHSFPKIKFSPFTQICFSDNVRAIQLGRFIFLVVPEPFSWVAVPNRLASVVALCNGQTTAKIREALNGQDIALEDFLLPLVSAGILKNVRPQVLHPLPKPLLLKLEMTYACNLRCKYCYNDSGNFNTSHMSFDILLKSIDFAFSTDKAKYGVHVHFHGGEPLLVWQHIKKGIIYVKEKYTQQLKGISLSTNGTLLDKDKIAFLSLHQVQLRLSFDGLPHLHDAFRKYPTGAGSSAKVINALEILGDYPRLGIMVTVTEKCSDKLIDIVKFVEKYRVQSIIFRPCRAKGRAMNADNLKINTTAYISGLKQIVDEICQGKLSDVCIETIMRMLLPLLTNETVYDSNVRCGIGRDSINITTTGTIRCDMLSTDLLPSPGNIVAGIDSTTIEEIAALTKNRDKCCSNCLWTTFCKGGCLGNAWAESKSLSGRDTLQCRINMEMIPFLLERLAVQPNKLTEYFLSFRQST